MPTAFTYSGDPTGSPKDEVRFLMGDTFKERPMFGDKEVLYQITKTPNSKIAAAELLEIKARQFARQADFKVGDVSKSLSQISKQLLELSKRLRADARRGVLPFFGGLTHSGKDTLAADRDAVQPSFSIGMTDNEGALQLDGDVNDLLGLAK